MGQEVEMGHRSVEGENVCLTDLVMILANLWGGLRGLNLHWEKSRRAELGMIELW